MSALRRAGAIRGAGLDGEKAGAAQGWLGLAAPALLIREGKVWAKFPVEQDRPYKLDPKNLVVHST